MGFFQKFNEFIHMAMAEIDPKYKFLAHTVKITAQSGITFNIRDKQIYLSHDFKFIKIWRFSFVIKRII